MYSAIVAFTLAGHFLQFATSTCTSNTALNLAFFGRYFYVQNRLRICWPFAIPILPPPPIVRKITGSQIYGCDYLKLPQVLLDTFASPINRQRQTPVAQSTSTGLPRVPVPTPRTSSGPLGDFLYPLGCRVVFLVLE
jgi:hypothetical protein